MLIEHNFEIRSGHLLFKILEENVIIDKDRTFAEGFDFDPIERITKQRISIYFAQLKKRKAISIKIETSYMITLRFKINYFVVYPKRIFRYFAVL